MDRKEPLKLLTAIAYLDDHLWLEMRLEKRHKNTSNYVFVEGATGQLKDYSDIFEDYYVERVLINQEKENHLLIQAVKEVNGNERS